MLSAFKNWLKGLDQGDAPQITADLAAAALMTEVMLADDELEEAEEQAIRNTMIETLAIPSDTIDEIIVMAKERVEQSHDLYQFTKRINESYSVDEKYRLIVCLWKVAYADGNLDRYEDHMIRKITELLYLHHSHFMKAKHEARENS